MSRNETLEVGEFTTHLRNVGLPMGLMVDDVRLAGRGLFLQREPFVAKVQEPGQLEVFVSEASLASFLNAQAPAGLKDFRVEARDGKLFVQAIKTVIVDLKASAVCTIRIVDQSKLMVDIESVDVGGAGIKTLIQNQMDRLNPVLDVADFPVRAKLLSVRIEKNGIILFGTVEP